jgi:hypothetical protein
MLDPLNGKIDGRFKKTVMRLLVEAGAVAGRIASQSWPQPAFSGLLSFDISSAAEHVSRAFKPAQNRLLTRAALSSTRHSQQSRARQSHRPPYGIALDAELQPLPTEPVY